MVKVLANGSVAICVFLKERKLVLPSCDFLIT